MGHVPLPEEPWPHAPRIPIRCNVCDELRRFEDRHRPAGRNEIILGPPCQVCRERLIYCCTRCGSQWYPTA